MKIKPLPIFFLLCIALPCFAARTYITGLRVIRKPHHWQFVFETTAPLKPVEQYLSKPPRAVFDFKNTHLKKMFLSSQYIRTPVTKIRVHHNGNTLRLVLDLDHKVQIKSFTLPKTKSYKNRFVIDLKGHFLDTMGFNTLYDYRKKITPKFALRPVITPVSAIVRRQPNVMVVIDPGHGGKDPGATGAHGTHEKNVVLAISKNLQRDINRIPGFKAVLTRRGDYFIPLRGRLAIARRDKADMFIAIHADAYRDDSAQGVSVFALSSRGATSEAARWIAAKENKSELMGGVDLGNKSNLLKSVLINLSQMATVRTSIKIGEDLVDNIGRYAHLHHGDRVEQAAFVVLKSPDIPSLLIETGFISNRVEERRLTNPAYQRRLAHSISRGICDYFEKHPPRGTSLANHRV